MQLEVNARKTTRQSRAEVEIAGRDQKKDGQAADDEQGADEEAVAEHERSRHCGNRP